MSTRMWLVVVLNGALMVAVAHRYVQLRDAWRSHNMAVAAWEVLEKDQLQRGQEIFGPGFILREGPGLREGPAPPTNTPAP